MRDRERAGYVVEMDEELEQRGHKFVRYADDCNIYVRTRRSGERVKASVTAFLQSRLRLRINEGKSAVDRPCKRTFLGFTLYEKDERIQLAAASVKRVKERIRSLTQRSAGISQAKRIQQLNQYLGGWMGYFALSELPSLFRELDAWLRRRLRMCRWKQWKRTYTRMRELRALGLRDPEAWAAARSRKSYWRIASSPPLHQALSNAYWHDQGLIALADRYRAVRNAW